MASKSDWKRRARAYRKDWRKEQAEVAAEVRERERIRRELVDAVGMQENADVDAAIRAAKTERAEHKRLRREVSDALERERERARELAGDIRAAAGVSEQATPREALEMLIRQRDTAQSDRNLAARASQEREKKIIELAALRDDPDVKGLLMLREAIKDRIGCVGRIALLPNGERNAEVSSSGDGWAVSQAAFLDPLPVHIADALRRAGIEPPADTQAVYHERCRVPGCPICGNGEPIAPHHNGCACASCVPQPPSGNGARA